MRCPSGRSRLKTPRSQSLETITPVSLRPTNLKGPPDEHIWAGEYQRDYRSLLALQEEVARTIAERIEISLTPQEQERLALASTHPLDPEAYEDYLKGRYFFNQRTQEAVNKSIGFFQQAIARHPGYALAYSGLADAYAILGYRGGFPSKDSLSRAKAAALKAIELDDTLAEPHASLAFIAETHEWDWATAEREYKRALQLNPGDARAHHWYAGYLMYVGRFEEGISEERRARDLDRLAFAGRKPGQVLRVPRIDQIHLDATFFEDLVDGDPIHSGRLHGHRLHSTVL